LSESDTAAAKASENATVKPAERRITTGKPSANVKFKSFFAMKKDGDGSAGGSASSTPRQSMNGPVSSIIEHESNATRPSSMLSHTTMHSIAPPSSTVPPLCKQEERLDSLQNNGDAASDSSEGTQPDTDAAQARTDGAELTAEQIQAFNESTKLMIQHNTSAAGEDSHAEEQEIIGWQMRRLGLIPRAKLVFGSNESVEKEAISLGEPFRFQINLYDESKVIVAYPDDMTFEKILMDICTKYGYNYKDMTFEYGKKPNLETVDMDKKLEIYSKESALIDLWIMKKSKSYSQYSVKCPDSGKEILSYQMIDGV
jgi:hypothetical protein